MLPQTYLDLDYSSRKLPYKFEDKASKNLKLINMMVYLNYKTSFLCIIWKQLLVSGVFRKLLGLLFLGFSAWFYRVIQPPPPKICGSPGGPPITAPRIKLRDGRHLAYKEHGVPKDKAKYKIVSVHGFDSCRHDTTAARALSPVHFDGFSFSLFAYIQTSILRTVLEFDCEDLSQELLEGLGLYILSFDRPGYGESDPDPKRTVKSAAMDVEELADQLALGSKFYVIGGSMGGVIVWSCLKYIPNR